MNIPKAIEILQYHSERNAEVAGSAWHNALRLGIEALKVLQLGRKIGRHVDPALLPGETED